MSMPGPAPSVYSPFCRCGMPQANSITSSPRWTSPRESASTLPCSLESMCASSSMFFSTSDLKLNMTRARRCGLTLAHSGKTLSAASTAPRISPLVANGTLAWTSPVDGLNTSPKRPEAPFTCWPAMKWVSSFIFFSQLLDLIGDGAVLAADAVEGEAGLRIGVRAGEIDAQRVLAVRALRVAGVVAFALARLRLAARKARPRRQGAEGEPARERSLAQLVLVRCRVVELGRVVAQHADQVRMRSGRHRLLRRMMEPPISTAHEHQRQNDRARDDHPRPLHENLRKNTRVRRERIDGRAPYRQREIVAADQ